MKMYKVKNQEEAVKNAKLFYEAVKLAWGLQVTYCYHDLIHMIKNDFSILLGFLLQCRFRSTHHRGIYPTLCTELFKPQESPQI